LPAARHTAAAAVDLCLPASINASASIYVPGNSFPIAARPVKPIFTARPHSAAVGCRSRVTGRVA
jgi:hypothetical protein